MRKEIEYDIYCDEVWVAGANNEDEAMRYAHQYAEDGEVEVYKVEKKITFLALIASKLKAKVRGER